jgi:PHP family Zn ribbon phosphoesterase
MVEIKEIKGSFGSMIDRTTGAKTIEDMRHLESLLDQPTYFARVDLGLGNYTITPESESRQVSVEPDSDLRGIHLAGHGDITHHPIVQEDFEEYKQENKDIIEKNLKMYRDIKELGLKPQGSQDPDNWTKVIKKYNIKSLIQIDPTNTRVIDGKVVPFIGCFRKGGKPPISEEGFPVWVKKTDDFFEGKDCWVGDLDLDKIY